MFYARPERSVKVKFCRNKEAQSEAQRLRRQVLHLLEEAVELGLLSKESIMEEQEKLDGQHQVMLF